MRKAGDDDENEIDGEIIILKLEASSRHRQHKEHLVVTVCS